MRISPAQNSLTSFDASNPEMMDAELSAALLEKTQGLLKEDGASAVRLIEAAGVNRPLTEGPVGRLINIKI